MPKKSSGRRIKDDDQYETLRRQGMSKEKAARIANTGKQASRKGGKSTCSEKSFDPLNKATSQVL